MILKPFNGTFLIVVACFILLYTMLSIVARKTSPSFAKKLYLIVVATLIVFFLIYKAYLPYDKEYNDILIKDGQPPHSVAENLPLHICDFALLLIPLGVCLNQKTLMTYCCVFAPLFAFIAAIAPMIGFSGYSFFKLRMAGYYITHLGIAFTGLALISFGLHKPTLKTVKNSILLYAAMSLGITIVNILLIKTGILTDANFFFTMNGDVNPILGFMYRLIPVAWLYQMPFCVVAYLICIVIEKIYVHKTSKAG